MCVSTMTGAFGYTKAGLAMALVFCALTASGQQKAVMGEAGSAATREQTSPWGVCPPFHLRDEEGNVINPAVGENADKPYSPKQTCGQCHDYDKITQGYHFMQGKGEEPTADQKARCLWASTPGNFGGTWCSPAPLYPYLSPKKNTSPATMDMTSFTFITKGCGNCHPGGGSAEFDREGKRYDFWMNDPSSGFNSGADNDFDGDYYKARWSETGVLEADCLLCHMPEYGMSERKKQLGAWNFRWAATAGAGFAKVTGSVSEDKPVGVAYDKQLFNDDGTLEPHIVREPRNEVCLSCHAKPGWKKRGANFRPRTDVHLRAGLKCVDCHPAGRSATDSRIADREEHQFGKGDDPGGFVRDDLDDTGVSCADCHDTGRMGAPIAKHRWLPPLHLEKIACQTCHIPERPVKAALIQAGDVFNSGAKIPTKGKHLWTFYGPDGKYWNHYGDLEMMGYDDKPTDPFRPVLARYKGKIYPVNRIHSAWPAIEVEGETALMQPKMGDIYKMWTAHQADATKYPELSKIADDNGDDVPEVNRPEEIDALIQSVTQVLADTNYPMEGKRVVWVMDDRVYTSGTEFRTLDMHPWEASPYANAHKYNHGVLSANAALGVNGCTDCHHPESDFFFASNVKYLFDENAQPVTQPQYRLLGLSLPAVRVGAWREAYLKPVTYGMIVVLCLGIVAAAGGAALGWVFETRPVPAVIRLLPPVIAILAGVAAVMLLWRPRLMEYMLPTRFWLDSNHFLIAVGILIVGLVAFLWELKGRVSGNPSKRSWLGLLAGGELLISLVFACVAGVLIFLKIPGIDPLTRYSYSIFELAVALVVLGTIASALRHAGRMLLHSGAKAESAD
ncbi:MAG: hypothetical protein HQ582_12680 [Planctomycetes bacterium]|nr:hypothetical protein [Planctomycetota bacterium]